MTKSYHMHKDTIDTIDPLGKVKPTYCLKQKPCRQFECNPDFSELKYCRSCSWNMKKMSKEETKELIRLLNELGVQG